MLRGLKFRIRSRSAVSTMIGGIIVLSLLLTALGTMVFVSQQYDSYQTIVNHMSQLDIDRFSENLVANYPGLIAPSVSSTCGSSTCYQYTMILSNVGGLANMGSSNGGGSGGSGGGVGVRIVRIYVNSTGSSGCVPPIFCLLNPSNIASAYGFRSSQSFLNPGEVNHNVTFWIPSSLGLLPNPTPPTPESTVWIVTSRGRVFSFQWPFPQIGPANGGQSGSAITTGIMKIAYQGQYDSECDYQGANKNVSPCSSNPGAYCHNEPLQPYPAPPGYGEKLTGISAVGDGGVIYFLNPWSTDTILGTVLNSAGTGVGTSTLYIYTNVENTRSTPITVTQGGIGIVGAGSTPNAKNFFLGGALIGIYYKGTFYAAGSSPQIQPNQSFYAIYQMSNGYVKGLAGPIFFLGYASVSNTAKDSSYFSGEILLDGLFDVGTC